VLVISKHNFRSLTGNLIPSVNSITEPDSTRPIVALTLKRAMVCCSFRFTETPENVLTPEEIPHEEIPDSNFDGGAATANAGSADGRHRDKEH
jgi:hypothetical protein